MALKVSLPSRSLTLRMYTLVPAIAKVGYPYLILFPFDKKWFGIGGGMVTQNNPKLMAWLGI